MTSLLETWCLSCQTGPFSSFLFVLYYFFKSSFLQFSSVAQLCRTLCDPMDFASPIPGVYSNSCPLSQTFPHSQSIPSGSFHKPLILLHQRSDRIKTTITENKPNWSHGPQPCLMQHNYEPCRVGPPKTDGSWWRVLTKQVHRRREWQTTSVFLPWEPHQQYEKTLLTLGLFPHRAI